MTYRSPPGHESRINSEAPDLLIECHARPFIIGCHFIASNTGYVCSVCSLPLWGITLWDNREIRLLLLLWPANVSLFSLLDELDWILLAVALILYLLLLLSLCSGWRRRRPVVLSSRMLNWNWKLWVVVWWCDDVFGAGTVVRYGIINAIIFRRFNHLMNFVRLELNNDVEGFKRMLAAFSRKQKIIWICFNIFKRSCALMALEAGKFRNSFGGRIYTIRSNILLRLMIKL